VSSKRTATWLAWSMCALSLALTALSFLLIALILNLNTPIYFYWLEPTAIAVGYSVIGVILVPRLPHHPIGWICCAIGFLAAVEHFSGEYAIYALVAQPNPLAGGKAALWIEYWFWIPMIGLIVFLLLLFPTGRLPRRRWRWVAWLSAAVTLIATILAAISPDAVLYTLGPSDTGRISLPNPLGVEELPNLNRPVQALVLILALVAVASLIVVRLRRARGVERLQIKWLIYAGAIGFGGMILRTYFSPLIGESWGQWVGYLVVAVGVWGGPVAIGVAILRYRLYEIDLIINRTLVYGSLTATLVLFYLGSVTALQYIFSLLAGQGNTVAIVASTLAIAALFNPLRRRIQSFIDRRFYRRKYDAAKTLEAFGSRLREETDLERISEDLVEVVRETMQPAHVSLLLRSGIPSSSTKAQGQQEDQRTTMHED
jgi:MFS family permease